MAIIQIDALGLAAGGILGLVLLSIFNNAGAVICKVYFEPWLKNFKARHDKVFNDIANGKYKHKRVPKA
jgi:hypothetical protein